MEALTTPLLISIGIFTGIGPFAVDTYLAAFPEMAQDLGASSTMIQFTLTGFMVGFALGQLALGALSDRFGRRPLLLLGMTGFAVFSLVATFAPNIGVLIAVRFLQGLFGASGSVLARAIVADLSKGVQAAQAYSILSVITGIAPVIAPLLGGATLLVTNWRGIFAVVTVIGVILMLVAFFRIPETLPVRYTSAKSEAGVNVSPSYAQALGQLARRKTFIGSGLVFMLCMAVIFGYIAGSPFVLQEVFGFSPTAYALTFGATALSMTLLSLANARLVRRISSAKLLATGILIQLIGSAFMVIGAGQLAIFLPAMVATVVANGLTMPNAMALAMTQARELAGTASAFLGSGQFLLASAMAPLVGIAGPKAVLPMAIAMFIGSTLAAAAFFLTQRASRPEVQYLSESDPPAN